MFEIFEHSVFFLSDFKDIFGQNLIYRKIYFLFQHVLPQNSKIAKNHTYKHAILLEFDMSNYTSVVR